MTKVPASWGSVVAGDIFLFGARSYTLTNTVMPGSGVMSGATFTPALTAALTSGTSLTVTHYRTSTAKGFDMLVNALNMTGTLIQATDWTFTILADGAFHFLGADGIHLTHGHLSKVAGVPSGGVPSWTLPKIYLGLSAAVRPVDGTQTGY